MILARRKFLVGLGSIVAAPVIIPYGNLMPVKTMVPLQEWETIWHVTISGGSYYAGWLTLGKEIATPFGDITSLFFDSEVSDDPATAKVMRNRSGAIRFEQSKGSEIRFAVRTPTGYYRELYSRPYGAKVFELRDQWRDLTASDTESLV